MARALGAVHNSGREPILTSNTLAMTKKEKIQFLEASEAKPENSKKTLWKTNSLWLAWWAMENDMHCNGGFGPKGYFCFIWADKPWIEEAEVNCSFILPRHTWEFARIEDRRKQFDDFCLKEGHVISGYDILVNDWEKLLNDIIKKRAEWPTVDKLILVASALRLIPASWADNMRKRIGQNM